MNGRMEVSLHIPLRLVISIETLQFSCTHKHGSKHAVGQEASVKGGIMRANPASKMECWSGHWYGGPASVSGVLEQSVFTNQF